MTVFINYRVYDHEGKYIGATGVGLTVSAVKEIIETYQEGYEAYDRKIYFVDQRGEEFMILMKECRLNDAFIMAEKIRKSLADNPCRWSDSDITVTVSLGVSQWNLLDDSDEDSIVIRADKALYMAKEGGRNRTVKLA